MAARKKIAQTQRVHEGFCATCEATGPVERVKVVGATNGLLWRCKGAGHLDVAKGSVRAVEHG